MNSLIGAILVGAALVLAGPAAISPASAAPQAVARTAGKPDASDSSVRRYDRRHYGHYSNRPHHPPRYYAYYDRPNYYRPYPYSVPAPFTFGFAFDPPWW